MSRPRWTAILVSAFVAAVALVAVPSSPTAAAAFECRAGTPGGQAENRWLGGSGSWSDAGQWSLAEVPGADSRDYACIPPGSDVVIDSATARVDLNVLELGRGSHLTLDPGTALYVWGSQGTVRSVTRPDSVLEVDGATLGGIGRLRVMGLLRIHRSTGGSPAILTSRPLTSPARPGVGILEIGDDGKLVVDGTGDVRLARGYVVDVRGRAVLREDGGLKANHGTAFLLQRKFHTRGAGLLLILNDRGFAEGAWNGITSLATFVNDGAIVKREATGTSHVLARYYARGRVEEKTGHIEVPFPLVEHPPFTGPCGAAFYCDGDQSVSLRLPVTDFDGWRIDVQPTEASRVKGRVAQAMRVHATDLDATLADPVVLRLGYTVSALRRAGAPADPAKLDVARAEDPDDPFIDIPECDGHAIPLGEAACLDVASSGKTGSGGVVLVVRTVELSRWVAR